MADPLDRHYTPDSLAVAIVDWVATFCTPEVAVEMCTGGGAFVRALRGRWPGVRIIGSDVDPDAEGLALCDDVRLGDCRRLLYPRGPGALVITNPPFTTLTDEARALSFGCARAAIEAGREGCTVLLLPASWVAGGPTFDWLRSPEYRPQIVRVVQGRVWSGIREMAVYVWPPGQRGGPCVIADEMLTYAREGLAPMNCGAVVAPAQESLF